MIIYEMRQSVYDKAFDLIEEAKKGQKMTKNALCELYDCLMDCYESEVDSDPIETEESVSGDENYANIDKVEIGEIDYRSNMRNPMRDGSNMHAMRMRNAMRMRRNRSGRYSY